MKWLLCVGVVTRLSALAANVVHDLVLALSGDSAVGKNHSQSLPVRIVGETIGDIVSQILAHLHHELGSGSDLVRIPRAWPLRRNVHSIRQQLGANFVLRISTILRLLTLNS